MRCRICGGLLESRVTDLPFKIGDSSIVILRSLPVLQCRQCGDTELEQVRIPSDADHRSEAMAIAIPN